MKKSTSTVFNRIRELVHTNQLNNQAGFSAKEVIKIDGGKLNGSTVGTFIWKHSKHPKVYFKRIERARYRILKDWL